MTDEELIHKHLELVIEANKIVNLTRIANEHDGMLLHVEDSLAGIQEINAAPEGLYGDMGTGGGYPGIPLAILTKRPTILIDSVKKKTNVLDQIINDLGLEKQVSTYGGRLEELFTERPAEFSVLTARALSQLSSLIELAAPLLCIKGQLICYKAQISPEEIAQAVSLKNKLGMKLVSQRKYLLSDCETQRCIIVFEKYKEAEIKLPRRTGMAQKRPLQA